MELIWTCHHRQNHADVLYRRHGLPRTPGKGLGGGRREGRKQSTRHGIKQQGAWITSDFLDLMITKQVQKGNSCLADSNKLLYLSIVAKCNNIVTTFP